MEKKDKSNPGHEAKYRSIEFRSQGATLRGRLYLLKEIDIELKLN